uniref:PABPN1 like, cytoplasmic n=1 Tax=Calidris pygmaea TaxID=425635 RepID=A0A8C3KA36_9CHAR
SGGPAGRAARGGGGSARGAAPPGSRQLRGGSAACSGAGRGGSGTGGPGPGPGPGPGGGLPRWQALRLPGLERESGFGLQELEAIKAKVREMEEEDERLKELQLEAESRFIMSLDAGTGSEEKKEVDQRSIYVGNVDYGGTAEELESHFNSCGQINRVTILCDKFSGHPKGYAYIEFKEKSSVKAAVELDESMFRGRVIKVLPKRTNMPGISTTDRGGYRGRFQAWGGLTQRGGYYGGQHLRVRGRTYRGRARLLPWYFPY